MKYVSVGGLRLPAVAVGCMRLNGLEEKAREHFIGSALDAGLAAQNVEMMGVSLGLGMLYNGYLARVSDANEELKQWLGIGDRTIRACMLLGYPAVHYARTAPRKTADVIWK